MRLLTPMAILSLTAFSTAQATKPLAEPAPASMGAGKNSACPRQEQVILNVNFNGKEASIKGAKALFEKRIEEIEEFAKKFGAKKMILTNMNYNISAQANYSNGMMNGITEYQLNGNAGYQMDNADMAASLMEELAKKNISSSMNVSSYAPQPCPIHPQE